MSVRELTTEEAARVAVRAAGLADGPSTVLEVAERLGDLQLDPTSAVERSHLLVLWSRLPEYRLAELDALLWDEPRRLFEYSAFVYPVRDLAVHAVRMRSYPSAEALGATRARKVRAWLDANVEFERYVLAELRRRGPLLSRDLEDRAAEPWTSSGWTHGKNVTRMLETLWAQGKVLVAAREGRERVWDLGTRVLPQLDGLDVPDAWSGLRARLRIATRAAGVARPRSAWQRRAFAELAASGEVEEVAVGESRGPWYAHPSAFADDRW